MKVITIFSLLGIILLLIATIFLVLLNWNNEIIIKVVSGILIGTLTVFISVYFSLQESNIKKSFTTSITIDEQEHLPVYVPWSTITQKNNNFHSEIYKLSRPHKGIRDKTKLIVKKPANFEETIIFLQELLQYKFVCDIATIQRKSWSVTQIGVKSHADINTIYKPKDLEKFEGKKVLEIFATNQFSKDQGQIFNWQNGYLPLPKNTKLIVEHIPHSKDTGTEKHKIILLKPNYFKTEIVIEPLLGTGLGVTADGLVIDDEKVRKRCQTYHFMITMNAIFDRITSGSPKKTDYIKWIEWLAAEVERINSGTTTTRALEKANEISA